MPISPDSSISLLTFPQLWDGASLVVRFLCLPRVGPLTPLRDGLTSFADSNFIFQAKLIGSLDRLPLPADATSSGPLLPEEPPVQKSQLFAELAKEFSIVARKPLAPRPEFRKAMTDSYRALIGNRTHSGLLRDPDEFACALHEGASSQPNAPVPPSPDITWGQLMAHTLRQPKLATALGLMGQVTVTPADPSFFAAGGWVYLDLDASSDFGGDAKIANRYAARIPKLTTPRQVFSALLFPVTDKPTDFIFDDVALEAELYDDGLAKLVHCAQGGGHGDSIQLGWDDEQVAEWLKRQVNMGLADSTDAPNAVAGYRVDVRQQGSQDWNSLTRVESLGDLKLGPFSLGSFQGEGIVEVAPAQLAPNAEFWLPSYFANWRGCSLVLTDSDLTDLHARSEVRKGGSAHLLDREKVFMPVGDKAVPLRYGQTYEFRVRLADLTRGGPDAGVALPDPPRNSIASLLFQRRKSPGPVGFVELPSPASRKLVISKPRLGHPEALFTGSATFENLLQDVAILAANPDLVREISVLDPDVVAVEITVQAKALDGDFAQYVTLYTTTRTFDKDQLDIVLTFEDHPTLLTLAAKQPAVGSLTLPTARDLRLSLVSIGRDKPGYFVSEDARRSEPVTLNLRAASTVEANVLGEPETSPSLRSFFFQPPPPDNSVSPPGERLAAELGLDHVDLMLSGRAGRRTVIGCSAELAHTLSTDSSAITFSSAADLVRRWINVVQFQVLRDWTWNGLDPTGVTLTRVVHFPDGTDLTELAGSIRLPPAIARKALIGRNSDPRDPARQATALIFFDALDPKPKLPRTLPSEITVEYQLQPVFQGLPAVEVISRSIHLPITTPPSRTPSVFSAGIALSGFHAAHDYSSTAPRQRMLWFELNVLEDPTAGVPAPGDSYYVRVLAKGPDPLLLPFDITLPDTEESPLPIDPEWMRAITPGQLRDESGLSAMQELVASPESPGVYLVPLPPDLHESSPELFGFFVYEIRLGHNGGQWSTAQGRFGPLLRVAGVQHPAPPLVCQAVRDNDAVLVQAPFAAAVANGSTYRSRGTNLWALLYARVRQADGSAFRNVLINRVQLVETPAPMRPGLFAERVIFGEGLFTTDSITRDLQRLGLPADQALTVLAAEVFVNTGARIDPPAVSAAVNPLGERLGHARIMRISPLVPVPNVC